MSEHVVEHSIDNTANNSSKMTDREALVNRSESESLNRPSLWNFEAIFERLIRPCITELLAVALFVFIGTTAACSSISVEGIALAHGLAIALLVTVTGSISGGHLNPAVTLGVFIGGSIEPIKAALYVVSQITGAILGAAFTLGVVGNAVYELHDGGGHTLPDNSYPGQAVLCEILLTYLLVTTVLVSAVDSSSKSTLAPLAIGFAVAVDILAGASVSGASMNPARSFGPAVVVDNNDLWTYHWIYWMGPLVGGAIAGILYRLFLAGPEKRIFPHLCLALRS